MTRKLHAVPDEPAEQPMPDLSYEYRERQRITSRDWAKVHVAADKREPLPIFTRIARTWRR